MSWFCQLSEVECKNMRDLGQGGFLSRTNPCQNLMLFNLESFELQLRTRVYKHLVPHYTHQTQSDDMTTSRPTPSSWHGKALLLLIILTGCNEGQLDAQDALDMTVDMVEAYDASVDQDQRVADLGVRDMATPVVEDMTSQDMHDADMMRVDQGNLGDMQVTPQTSFRTLSLPDSPPFETGPREIYAVDCNATALDTEESIRTALEGAEEGQCIRIADGHYDLGSLTVTSPHIQIAGENKEGAHFIGSTHLILEGNGIVLESVEFLNGDTRDEDTAGIRVVGDDVHLSHITFRGWGSMRPDDVVQCIYIHYEADRLEISDSLFTDLYGMSSLQAQRANSDWVSAKSVWLHHNEWRDNPKRSFGNGGETIQIGTAWAFAQGVPGEGSYDDGSEMIFEHNLIQRHDLEGEIISIKSSQNIVRHNHFDDCDGAIVVRMGLSNLIYGNWMNDVDQRPIRISGERNVVAYNYFATGPNSRDLTAGVALHSEDRRDPSAAYNVNFYWAAVENVIERNIFVNFGAIAEGSNQRFEVFTTPHNNRFKHNLLLNTPIEYRDPYDNLTPESFFEDNVVTSNHLMTPDGERWQSDSTIDEAPDQVVDISGTEILWEDETLPAPEWWSAIQFE